MPPINARRSVAPCGPSLAELLFLFHIFGVLYPWDARPGPFSIDGGLVVNGRSARRRVSAGVDRLRWPTIAPTVAGCQNFTKRPF